MSFIRAQTNDSLKDFRSDSGEEPSCYIHAYHKAQQERQDNSTFTDSQLIASVVNLFLAGSDTTATTLRWAIFILAHHPEIQEQVHDEIRKQTGGQSLLNYADRTKLPLTEATLLETQRLANLVPLGVMHRTMAPSKLYGYDIPAGTAVVSVLTAVHCDPKVYPNPERFDPNRFLNANKNGEKDDVFTNLIPFGVGMSWVVTLKNTYLGASASESMSVCFCAFMPLFRPEQLLKPNA